MGFNYYCNWFNDVHFLKSSSSCDKIWDIVDKYIEEKRLYDDEAELTEDQVIEIKQRVNGCFEVEKKLLKDLEFGQYVLLFSD
jgi:hypothetical protein